MPTPAENGVTTKAPPTTTGSKTRILRTLGKELAALMMGIAPDNLSESETIKVIRVRNPWIPGSGIGVGGLVAGVVAGRVECVERVLAKYGNGPNSPCPVKAETFISIASKYKVPLDLMLAQGIIESHLGTDSSDTRALRTKNIFNVGNVDGGANQYESSWDRGVDTYASLMARGYFTSQELSSGTTAEQAIARCIARVDSGDYYASTGCQYAKQVEASVSNIRRMFAECRPITYAGGGNAAFAAFCAQAVRSDKGFDQAHSSRLDGESAFIQDEGNCQVFARQCVCSYYGNLYNNYQKVSASASGRAYKAAGLGKTRGSESPPLGALLYYVTGGDGHVGIMTSEGIAENSSTSKGRVSGRGALGFRRPSDYDYWNVIVVLP